MKFYNTVIVGGGASGILAAIYLDDKNSLLLERNDKLGKKILITGGGRCNITNNASFNEYMKSYYNSGNYYRPAFTNFFNNDIINLLEENNCKTKVEEDNRVFPVSDNSKSVVKTFTHILNKKNTRYELNSNVTDIIKKENYFIVEYNNNKKVKTKNVILSTGGSSYPKTGSDGSGYKLARKLGHNIPEKIGGLCPIEIEEKWINKLQGITINCDIQVKSDNKSIIKDYGSILFTHNGLSGYPILNNSMKMENNLRKNKEIILYVDLVGDYSHELLDKTLQEDFKNNPKKHLKNYLHKYLPKNMTSVFLEHLEIEDVTLNQTTKHQRILIKDNLKKTKLTVKRVCLEDAIVTNSGIKQKEIDPNTCESKVVENLYITGELIEGCGICGGFNLQKAFSTGVLAAKSIIMRNEYDTY